MRDCLVLRPFLKKGSKGGAVEAGPCFVIHPSVLQSKLKCLEIERLP